MLSRTDLIRTLDGEVQYFVSHGWRVRSRTPMGAELVKGEPISHGLHLFFSIATLGLWLIVYIPLLIFGGEKHKLISVDAKGTVTSTDRLPRDRDATPAA